MAGLFEKDIRILMQRKKALLLFLALSVFIGYSQDGTFILSYLPMLMIIVMIGTISALVNIFWTQNYKNYSVTA